MKNQIILNEKVTYNNINNIIAENHVKKLMLVCSTNFSRHDVNKIFDNLNVHITVFSDFTPNPKYESILKGVELFKNHECEFIIAIGGGSAIDVAKCIKAYSSMSSDTEYINQTIIENKIKLLAIPTTAGTGSESTRYSVIYYNNEKQSITHDSLIPEYVILDSDLLTTLPIYHRRTCMMDALCHAIESFWSVNSNEESISYASEAIHMIFDNMESYLENTSTGNKNMLTAANLAGKAINITQTTAAHAMSYKLTSLYGISHGHAVSICLPELWNYMLEHLEDCIDIRGKQYVYDIFIRIAKCMKRSSVFEAIERLENLIQVLELKIPNIKSDNDLRILVESVNELRLKNTPVKLGVSGISDIYLNLFNSPK